MLLLYALKRKYQTHAFIISYCCVVESQWKSPWNVGWFITRRNFWNELSVSAEVVYNRDAVHTQCSTADSTLNQTQKYYLT